MALANKRAAGSQILVRHYDIFSMGLCRCRGRFLHIAADRSEHRQAAHNVGLLDYLRGLVRSTAMEKRELGKIDFELIDAAFKALLKSQPDSMTADKIADLRDKFRDAFTGWLEIEEAA